MTEMSKEGKRNQTVNDKSYKCVFFDLDHTLWDYDGNARTTLDDLHERFMLHEHGIDSHKFFSHFRRINVDLWALYDRGLVTNEEIRYQRFRKVLQNFNVSDDELSDRLADEYYRECPTKPNLLPYAKEILDYLADNYALTIVTNGFDEVQAIKMTSGDIMHYFDHVITSRNAGHRKPAREIFEYALSINGLRHDEVIMVGDNLVTDVGGARNAQIDAVYYNPEGIPHDEQVSYEIRCLSELRDIL